MLLPFLLGGTVFTAICLSVNRITKKISGWTCCNLSNRWNIEREGLGIGLVQLLTGDSTMVGIQPVKKNGEDGGGGHWLVRMEWRPAGWPVCLPLSIFPCTIKSRSSLLALAHPGGPGKRAIKWLWCVVVVIRECIHMHIHQFSGCFFQVNLVSWLPR